MKIDMQRQSAQGDLIALGITDYNATLLGARQDSLVLAAGSATGHSHRMEHADGLAVHEPSEDEKRNNGVRVLVLDKPNRIVHDEHDPVPLEPGTYLIRRQREANSDLTESIVQD